jgi:hypothetical protein
MELEVKTNFFADPLKGPLRLFVVDGEPNISRTALFAETTSARLRKISITTFHAANQHKIDFPQQKLITTQSAQ